MQCRLNFDFVSSSSPSSPLYLYNCNQWCQRLTNIGGRWLKPAQSEARQARRAGVMRRSGLGRDAVALPNMGFGAIAPGNFLNFNMQICAFWCILREPLRQITCTVSTCYFNQFIVLDSTLQLEWIQPTSWPIAISVARQGTSGTLGDRRYSVHGWPNIAGMRPRSPMALTPLTKRQHRKQKNTEQLRPTTFIPCTCQCLAIRV